jgi:hypothetical protein
MTSVSEQRREERKEKEYNVHFAIVKHESAVSQRR